VADLSATIPIYLIIFAVMLIYWPGCYQTRIRNKSVHGYRVSDRADPWSSSKSEILLWNAIHTPPEICKFIQDAATANGWRDGMLFIRLLRYARVSKAETPKRQSKKLELGRK
jgi:hypothetical protein